MPDANSLARRRQLIATSVFIGYYPMMEDALDLLSVTIYHLIQIYGCTKQLFNPEPC